MEHSWPGSDRFRLEQLAEGVWGAVAAPGRGAGSNSGIIDLGGRTLVFDAFQTPQAAAELRQAAQALTGGPVTYLVNSHYHGDHTFGNQVFEPAVVIGTATTRSLLAERGPQNLKAYVEKGPDHLQGMEGRLAAMVDDAERARFALQVEQTRELVQAAPLTRLVLPEVLVAVRLVIEGSRRRVELLVLAGHTPSDLICWLPAERLLFAGDLLFVESHPWLGHGEPERWLDSLDRLEGLGVERLLPGHGEVAGPEWIGRMRQYIRDVTALATTEAARGTSPEAAAGLSPVAPYAGYGLPEVFGWNMHFLVQRAREQ